MYDIPSGRAAKGCRWEKNLLKWCSSPVFPVVGMLAVGAVLSAQSPQPGGPAVVSSQSPGQNTSAGPSNDAGTGRAIQAYVDFLSALNLAEEGSKPEALQLLAESLRLQPDENPSSGLVFELLTELRANSRLLLRGHTDAVLYAAYSPDGTEIVTASADHTARVWDAHTGKQLIPPLHHDGDVLMAEFSPDGKRVVTGSEDHTGRIWDARTGRPIGVPIRQLSAVRYVKFSPDGQMVATASDGGEARIWNADAGLPISPPVKYHESVFCINFSPDGTRLVTGTGDDVADVRALRTGAPLIGPIRHNNNIFTAVFSPDGGTILTASADRTAQLWDAKTGQAVSGPFRHGFWILSAAFNHDGSRVVTASWDHTARVWDAKTGKAVTPPLRHGDAVFSAVFSPDGNLVATASRDHTARVWDANSGEPLTLPLRAQDVVTTAIFDPRGFSLLVASKDSSIQVFDMPPHEPPPSWVADLAEFSATQVRYDIFRAPDLDKMKLLRAQLLASKSTDPWEAFGRWYFTESDRRGISPWSTVSLQQYVEALIALGDEGSLAYASSLAQDHPTWMAKIVPLRAKVSASAPNQTGNRE
jgi:WD40 repeat protein